MPMPKFPYGQGHFLRCVNEYWEKPETREIALKDLKSRKPLMKITDERREDNKHPSGITQAERDHFDQHWMTRDRDGSAPSFPGIPPRVFEAVMRDGYRKAIEIAGSDWAKKDSKDELPMSVAWVCAPGTKTFDIVTIVNRGVHVQVLLISPLPLEFTSPSQPHEADHVFVTRYFATRREVKDVEKRLTDLGSQDARVRDPDGNRIEEPQGEGQAGTFQIWL